MFDKVVPCGKPRGNTWSLVVIPAIGTFILFFCKINLNYFFSFNIKSITEKYCLVLFIADLIFSENFSIDLRDSNYSINCTHDSVTGVL